MQTTVEEDNTTHQQCTSLTNALVQKTPTTLSFFMLFWERIHQQHPWIQQLSIFLDNATSLCGPWRWCDVHVTKFAPERLLRICDQCATTFFQSVEKLVMDEQVSVVSANLFYSILGMLTVCKHNYNIII